MYDYVYMKSMGGGVIHSEGHHSVRTRTRYWHWAAFQGYNNSTISTWPATSYPHYVARVFLRGFLCDTCFPHLPSWFGTKPPKSRTQCGVVPSQTMISQCVMMHTRLSGVCILEAVHLLMSFVIPMCASSSQLNSYISTISAKHYNSSNSGTWPLLPPSY
jgi:hypothetical protein